MDYVVIGGDARMDALAEHLRRKGRGARHILAGGEDARAILEAPEIIRGARNIVVNSPPATRGLSLTLENVCALAAPGARIFLCGPGDQANGDERLIDLWADEALLRENACLTAEGAVSAAMRAARRCVKGMACTVIGWGRIGSALAELLVAMGAHVTVASRSRAHRHRAIERGAEAVAPDALPRVLPGADLVISTPPAMVLNAALIECVNPEALVIDLASPPYGVDLQAAWARGLRAWREPGLPGRYCPESAGLAIMRAIERMGEWQ